MVIYSSGMIALQFSNNNIECIYFDFVLPLKFKPMSIQNLYQSTDYIRRKCVQDLWIFFSASHIQTIANDMRLTLFPN